MTENNLGKSYKSYVAIIIKLFIKLIIKLFNYSHRKHGPIIASFNFVPLCDFSRGKAAGGNFSVISLTGCQLFRKRLLFVGVEFYFFPQNFPR